MTQSICVIGDSHLAAIKLAWDDVRHRFPDVSIDMFGSHAASLRDTAFVAGRIVPTTDEVVRNFKWTAKAREIALEKYSTFYIIAGSFSSLPVFRLYSQYGYYELNGRRKYLISKECYRRAALGWLRAVPAMHLFRLIRPATSAPVYLCAQALPSDGCIEDPASDIVHKDAIANQDEVKLFELYLDLCRELRAEDVVVIQQPDSTKSGIALTKREYSTNSVGLTPDFSFTHPANDHFHMNRLYGVEMINAMFDPANR